MSIKVCGDFEIYFDRVLGHGGMGTVYMGRQISVNRPAAIKILKQELTDNIEFVQRFHREAALLARLVDSHVVQIFGAGEFDGRYFYAMEYVEGEDLATRLQRDGKFPIREVLEVAERVGKAMQAAWRYQIVHRDIKPSNIVRTREHLVKVMDFGLAKSPDSDLTRSEMIMGTAKYMSPEQASGTPCDIRSDLYSLGIVLYELATGTPPFVGDNPTAVIYQHVHRTPIPPRQLNPDVPLPLQTLILRLMAKAPEDRYASPDVFLADVKSILEGVSIEERTTLMVGTGAATPAPTVPESTSAQRRSPWAIVAGVLAVVGLAVAAGAFVLMSKPSPGRAGGDPPAAVVGETQSTSSDAVPAAAYLDSLERGLEAYQGGQWTQAYTFLEEARGKGAPDLDEKIKRARANEQVAKGDAETDPERSLEYYEGAARFIDDPELSRKIVATSFRRWKASAEKAEGKDWARAAADWGRAVTLADGVEKEELEARRKFCADFADALRARATGDWDVALSKYEALAVNPKEYRKEIEEGRRTVREEVRRRGDADRKGLKAEAERLLEAGRLAYARGAWKDAQAAFGTVATDKKFAAAAPQAREEAIRWGKEVAAAFVPPPGMVYVPRGKFRMGRGSTDSVEGPEGEAETGSFYIDLRETTVREYAEFLQALGDAVHHSGCAKGEPEDKSHVPDRWEAQKKEDAPVVGVDWWDAAGFMAWRGKRLPTEAEWERAAGFDPAGRRVYPWGDVYGTGGGRSFLGCEAMGSGVIEWTADWFRGYSWSGAKNADFGEVKKTLRGGILLEEDAERDARVTRRHWYGASYRSSRVGFRGAKDVVAR